MTAWRSVIAGMTAKTAAAALVAVAFAPAVGGEAEAGGRAAGENRVFLGDSITHGGKTVGLVQLFWALRHPGDAVTFWNCGHAGGQADSGLKMIDEEFPAIRPEKVYVMFGMNDVWGEKWVSAEPGEEEARLRGDALRRYGERMKAIADRLGGRMVVLTPTPYDQYGDVEGCPAIPYRNDPGLATVAKIGRELAASNGLQVVDLHTKITAAMKARPEARFAGGDRVHPGEWGHHVMTAILVSELGEPAEFELTERKAGPDGDVFVYAPKKLPFPLSPAYREAEAFYPITETFNRETLRVTGLRAGDWELSADGRPLGVFSAEEFAEGVNLAVLDTPNQRLAQTAKVKADRLNEIYGIFRDCRLGARTKPGAKGYGAYLLKVYGENRDRLGELRAEADRILSELRDVRPVACRLQVRRRSDTAGVGESGADSRGESALGRFWRESEGRTVRRLPVDVLPENVFVILREDQRVAGFEVAETAVREICAKGTYNVITLTPRWQQEISGDDYAEAVRRLSDIARSYGVKLLADSDPRQDRTAFFARFPDKTLDLSVVTLGADGTNAVEAVCPSILETLSPAGGDMVGQGVRRVRVFAARVDHAGAVLSRRPLDGGDFNLEACEDRARITVASLRPGERPLAVVTFRRNSIDVFSSEEREFSRGFLERLGKLGADGGMRDEYGVSSTSGEPIREHRVFLTSESLLPRWREKTGGRDLTDDLALLSLPCAPAERGLRSRLIRAYAELVFETVSASERDFYRQTKEIFGADAYVAKHPTWQPVICAAEFLKNGLDWWAAPRDWAQTDEMTPVPAALGMAKKFGSPNWMNEGWKPFPIWYRKATWTYAMCGGRMVYHPLCGGQCYTYSLSPRDQFMRGLLDVLNGEQVITQCRIRLLNLVSDAAPDGEVALVFGHRRIMDWSDAAYEDWGRDLSCRLWEQGFPPDLYPSDELGNGTFRVTDDGWLAVGRETYRVLIVRHLDETDRAALERLTAGRRLKTRIVDVGDDGDAFAQAMAGLEGAVRQTPIEHPAPQPKGMLWDMVYPQPDGVLVLNDGTKARIKALAPSQAGDRVSDTLAFAGGSVSFDAEGVFAARLGADGKIEALGGAAVRRFSAPGLEAKFSRPYDFVLRRNPAGRLEGLWQASADAGEVPPELRRLAVNWRKLVVPSPDGAAEPLSSAD